MKLRHIEFVRTPSGCLAAWLFVGVSGALATQGTLSVLAADPPTITPGSSLESKGVLSGLPTSFSVRATGAEPLSYQWRRNGLDLPGQTNRVLRIPSVQREDDGDYTLAVSNPAGSTTSHMARLYVIPPVSELKRGNLTNQAGLRLPYYHMVPENYDPARSYPLVIFLHGSDADEGNLLTIAPEWASAFVLGSYGQQVRDPAILVLPTRRVDGELWTNRHLRQVSELLDSLMAEFNIDPNRVYLIGISVGVSGACNFLGLRPDRVAAAVLIAGGQSSASTAAIKHVPVWAFCAADDDLASGTQGLVDSLRRAGGIAIYTQYDSGGHIDGSKRAMSCPAMVDWMLAQRRGRPSTADPRLSITSPTSEATWITGGANLNLAGSAAALGQNVTVVTWENYTGRTKGNASGTNTCSVTGIPLIADKTNVVSVTARTTCFTPYQSGYTTFNDTLTVVCRPIRATLDLQVAGAVLNWSGGAPPYHVEAVTDLAAGNWTSILTNVVPPVTLLVGRNTAFYRIAGQ